MISSMAKYVIVLSGFLATATAFDASGNNNVALYWGQASAGSQESLATYCESDAADIMILSFMSSFPGTNGLPTLNFASACTETFSNGLLKCDQIAADIQTCQSLGKKVLLSMGGAAGSYGFSSDDDAEEFAGTLWNMFGEGSADERPFGDAVVDGFDFDIENNNDVGYAALATKLRSYFTEGSKSYYLSAAPQCVYPDASVGDAMANAEFDFAFIQFYNNYCAVGSSFNWDTWVDYAQNTSPNKNIKLYLGLPGSTSAAGSGYVDIDTIKSTLADIGDDSNFGGVMLWDASQGFTNIVDGEPFAEVIKDALNDLSGAATATATATSEVTTAASTASTVPVVAETTTSSSIDAPIVSTTSSATVPTTGTTSTSSVVPVVSGTSTPVAVPSFTTTLTPVGSSEVEDNTSLIVTTSTFVVKGASVSVTQSSAGTPTLSTKAQSTITTAASSFTKVSSKASVVTSTVVVAPSPVSTAATDSTSAASSPESESTSLTTQAPVPDTTTSTSETTAPATSTSSSVFVEVTSNTFTSSVGSTLKTVIVSSATSSAATATSTASASGCDSLSGSDKASCLNAQYTAGQFAGSPDTCTNGQTACSSSGEYAVCNWGVWVIEGCAAGTTCYAAPAGDDVFISCNWPQNEKHKRNVEHVHHDHS